MSFILLLARGFRFEKFQLLLKSIFIVTTIAKAPLYECCGIIHLDINMLLDAKPEDDYREWRDLILSELETYVDETKLFTTRVLSQ